MIDKQIDKKWIEAHVPHQGSMCLLEGVTHWSEQSITCSSATHQLASNPLRVSSRLNAACGIEYAAQAMAVHGALLAPPGQSRPRAGFLVSVRGCQIHCKYLDDFKLALTINAKCVNKSVDNLLYTFTVQAERTVLLEGRAAVMINSDSLLGTL